MRERNYNISLDCWERGGGRKVHFNASLRYFFIYDDNSVYDSKKGIVTF